MSLTAPMHNANVMQQEGTSMLPQIKINFTNGVYLTRKDHEYIAAGREGNECGARCPSWPGYRCSRDRNHNGDHAAHGWSNGALGRLIVMYARWSQ